jgi:hypothetical protein
LKELTQLAEQIAMHDVGALCEELRRLLDKYGPLRLN